MEEFLDQPISIQAPNDAADSYGGEERTWTEYLPTFAKVTPSSGGERTAGGLINAEAIYSFRVRNDALAAVTEDYRIVWNGVAYNIRFLPTGTRDRYINILAQRGVAV